MPIVLLSIWIWRIPGYCHINRPLTTLEYQKVIRHAEEIGITKGFMQIGKTNEEKFIPHFNGDHVLPEVMPGC